MPGRGIGAGPVGRAGMAGRVAATPAFGSEGRAKLGRCIAPTFGRWKFGVCMFGCCTFGIDGRDWGLAWGMLGRACGIWGLACGICGLACGIWGRAWGACGRAIAGAWCPPPPPARPTEGRAHASPEIKSAITTQATAATSRMEWILAQAGGMKRADTDSIAMTLLSGAPRRPALAACVQRRA
jgi:hypothetical protein